MKREIRSVMRSWVELARGLGFLILLVGGSATVGVIIAWPLWYFATSNRIAYTAFALLLALAGAVFATVRSIIKGRNAAAEEGRRRRHALSKLLGVLQILILVSGLYLVAVLSYHAVWIFAIPLFIVCLGLIVLVGLARRTSKTSRDASIVPKIRKE